MGVTMNTAAPDRLAPTRANERIQALDIARGLALFGIFMVNIQIMTQSIGWLASDAWHDEGALATGLHYITRVFFESKSYPLFSLLFGMGMALMYQRAKALNRPFVTPYLRRIFILALFGVLHALLLWYGDILFHYFLIALMTMWVVGLKPKWLLLIAGIAVTLAVLTLTGLTTLGMIFAPNGQAIPETTDVTTYAEFWNQLWDGKVQGGPMHPAWMVGEADAFQNGPLMTAVSMRAINWISGMIFWLIFNGTLFHLIGMFTLGAAIMKAGAFDVGSRLPALFVALGLVVGIPGSILIVIISERGGMNSPAYGYAASATHLVGPCLSLGYLGLAITLARRVSGNLLVTGIASAGRMALTNYLMQSFIVAAIAQHWGFALFSEVSRVQMVVIVVSVYAFQLVLSTLWLRAFTMGPLEYLWRTATYLRLPRLRAAS